MLFTCGALDNMPDNMPWYSKPCGSWNILLNAGNVLPTPISPDSWQNPLLTATHKLLFMNVLSLTGWISCAFRFARTVVPCIAWYALFASICAPCALGWIPSFEMFSYVQSHSHAYFSVFTRRPSAPFMRLLSICRFFCFAALKPSVRAIGAGM